jgi:mannosyl-oligosaccharide glucosidase
LVAADNKQVADGPFAAAFRKTIGGTYYLGRKIPSGVVWQAKGSVCDAFLKPPMNNFTDLIMKSLAEHARELIAPYKDPNAGAPDPSYTLQLPNDVVPGSNLYAIQKIFDGPFQFDVYYDSASSNQKLDGILCLTWSLVYLLNLAH